MLHWNQYQLQINVYLQLVKKSIFTEVSNLSKINLKNLETCIKKKNES